MISITRGYAGLCEYSSFWKETVPEAFRDRYDSLLFLYYKNNNIISEPTAFEFVEAQNFALQGAEKYIRTLPQAPMELAWAALWGHEGRLPTELESIVARDASASAKYAEALAKWEGNGAFPGGEEIIASDAWASLSYAMTLEARWRPGEAAIFGDNETSSRYQDWIKYREDHGRPLPIIES